MITAKQHKTSWTVTNLKTGGVMYYESEQQCRTHCLTYSGCYAIRRPIYQ